ncbi:MAG: prolipoprotein diacylglyceryl transferase [Polyangia bacterium]
MHPVLFVIPGIELPIYTYGVMLGLSFVVGWNIVMWLGRKDGLPRARLQACFVWTAIAAIVGSRLLFVITNLDQFRGPDVSPIEIINVRKGGMVAYGGLLGGFLGSWLYLRGAGIRLLAWADVAVPALATGLGITRIGCFCYGCCYGKPIPNDAPEWIRALGVRFPNWEVKLAGLEERLANEGACGLAQLHGAPAFQHHVHDGLVPPGAIESALVYPTQLIEVANGWILFAVLMILRRFRSFRGQIFCLFTVYYGVTRSLVEILRGDTQRGGVWILSTSQMVGAATALAAAIAWAVLAGKARRDPARAMSPGPIAEQNSTEEQPTERRRPRRK